MDRKEYRKKYYWEHREDSIKKATQWNKDNPDKRKRIYDKDNSKLKTKIKKKIWAEKKFYEGNQTTIGKVCELCGGSYRLGIHHKDGNNGKKGKELNNKPDNLVILCVRCHSAIHGWWGLKKI